MKAQLNNLLTDLKTGAVPFKEVIEFIENSYQHHPTAFKNGNTYNEASQNQGSAKVFAFAKINEMDVSDTLYLFSEHYQAVLNTPEGTDHQNIRQFMINGWDGIAFEGEPLTKK